MQAIQVKYMPATNTRGTRYKAWSYSGQSVTVSMDYSKEDSQNAGRAAMELLKKLEWNGSWLGGTLPNGDYCFVCMDANTPLIVGA